MESEAIFNTMEVLSTTPINELLTEATVKVCWVSDTIPNRNNTLITRAVGREIAASLSGAPVVGLFNKEEGDFVEHSIKLSIQNGEFKVEELTKPYGFVSPIDPPWYQNFEEDGVTRTYLMCKCFLWTRQYEEANLAFNKGQSMELNESSMNGYYQGNVFIFTSVVLDKLCILGDNYEPCFEGAKIMSTYALQYKDFTQKVEEHLGRRFFALDDKIVERKEDEAPPATTYTLEYVLNLGKDIVKAVENRLIDRGMLETEYDVEDIYSENGTIYAIVKRIDSMENVRVEVVITSLDTVDLGPEMIPVEKIWRVKPQAAPEGVDPINGEAAVVETEIPMNVAAVYAKENEKEVDEKEQEKPEKNHSIVNIEEETVETAEVETNTDIDHVTEEAAESVTEFTEEVTAEEPQVAEVPNEFQLQLDEMQEKLKAAEELVAKYKAIEDAAEESKKTEVITFYKAIMDEDEVNSIVNEFGKSGAEELESKFALSHMKKQRTEPVKPQVTYQVNVDSIEVDTMNGLPNFMLQAIEIDKAKALNISI